MTDFNDLPGRIAQSQADNSGLYGDFMAFIERVSGLGVRCEMLYFAKRIKELEAKLSTTDAALNDQIEKRDRRIDELEDMAASVNHMAIERQQLKGRISNLETSRDKYRAEWMKSTEVIQRQELEIKKYLTRLQELQEGGNS